jgi:hypothetical protein
MRIQIGLIAVGALLVSGLAAAKDQYVSPYVKKDGTVVQGHYKTEANNTKTDNYSSKLNVNPYTGQKGTKDPYKSSK